MRNNDRKLKEEPRDNQQRPMHAQKFEQRQNIILFLKISSLQVDGNIFYLWTEIDDVSLTLCRKISPPLTNDPLHPRWNHNGYSTLKLLHQPTIGKDYKPLSNTFHGRALDVINLGVTLCRAEFFDERL